jgi:hypothetical protein
LYCCCLTDYVGLSNNIRRRWQDENAENHHHQRTLSFFLLVIRPYAATNHIGSSYDIVLARTTDQAMLGPMEAVVARLAGIHPSHSVNVSWCGEVKWAGLELDEAQACFVDGSPTMLPCRGKHSKCNGKYYPLAKFHVARKFEHGRSNMCEDCSNAHDRELYNAAALEAGKVVEHREARMKPEQQRRAVEQTKACTCCGGVFAMSCFNSAGAYLGPHCNTSGNSCDARIRTLMKAPYKLTTTEARDRARTEYQARQQRPAWK